MRDDPIHVEYYEDASGKMPFWEWRKSLRDLKGKVAVLTRLNRIRVGNPGDWKSVGKGVCEFRIQQGPGYRIYFGKEKEDENRIVILLGGDKNSQKRDIAKAQDYWADYRGEK